MKYKKLLVFITCLLFLTVAVFCFASAFRITDIELNVKSLQDSNEDISNSCYAELKKYDGKNLVFLNTRDVENGLKKLSGYIEVESVKKEFPNKLTVKVKERAEVFSLKVGEDYFALDKNFNVLSKKTSLVNNVDGADNILLNISVADFNTNLRVGERLKVYDENTFSYLTEVAPTLNLLRKDLYSVTVTVKKDGIEYKTLTLKMREGVSFTIVKADAFTIEKINKTYEFYTALQNKGEGSYITVREDNGSVTVKQ